MSLIVSDSERSHDIYEQMAGYPKPPLIKLPSSGDMSSLARVGLKTSPAAYSIARAALWISGFSRFQQILPQRLEELLRQCDLRGGYLFAPVVSATLALKDDPRPLTPIERAATLVMAAGQLYQDIVTARLEPDRYRDEILEMGQYPNLFSTCLVVEKNGRPRIFKSTNSSRIIVMINGQQYALELGPIAQWKPRTIKRTLTELVEQIDRDPKTAPAGMLTGADHRTQLKIFTQLQQSQINQQSLSLLRHSLFILCLDLDHEPPSYAEAASIGHSGNFANRWFHAALQIVVFGNARACIICNFSTYLDGNTMMRAGAEIQRWASDIQLDDHPAANEAISAPVTHLQWQIAPHFLQRAQHDLARVVDHQIATFEIADLGKNYFAARDLDGVPIFMVALQMATKKLTGKMVQLRQFLTLSRYRCMGLADAIVTTPEVIEFVNYLDGDQIDLQRARRLLQSAIASQQAACRHARSHLSLDSLIGLYLVSSSGLKKRYIQFVVLVSMFLMRLVGLFKPLFQREVIVSHPEIYPEVPLVGRPGIRLPYVKYFGLHYQILSDRIILTMMPSVNWKIPNADFVAELEKQLKRIQQIIEGTINEQIKKTDE